MGKGRNIVLLGFMGVGKVRTARALAGQSGRYAIDCDDLIESFANKKIRKIFQEEGEAVFRELEKRTARWLENNVSGSVISTGGGFVNVPNINKVGTVVYLHADFDDIIRGIQSHPNAKKKIKKRPLLQDLDAARKLYNSRLEIYRAKADVEVNVAGREIEGVATEILDLIDQGDKE